MRSRLLFVVLATALVCTLGSTAVAQACASLTQTFWKRDTLPAMPLNLTAVSVIQGICQGESAGVVFTMPANMPVQKITQVVAPWGAAFGAPGFLADLDLEVYDGVSFSGANVNLGQQVFSLTQQANMNLQVQSHALNTLDTSTYNIIVGAAPPIGGVRRFAICFRVDANLHPTGTCATGYPANFFTDNSQQISFPFTCNPAITPQQTSIIEILGQGWRDAALATVFDPLLQISVPVCPIYYSGIWVIRCCSEDAFPATYTVFAPGCNNSTGVASQLVNAALPRLGQTMLVNLTNMPANPMLGGARLGLMITGDSNSFDPGFGSLPFNLNVVGMPSCSLNVSLQGLDTLISFGPTASWSASIPNQTSLLGAQLYQQAFVTDPGLNPFGGAMSQAAEFQVGN